MPITYTSPHHSAEDPSGLIHDVMALGEDFSGSAREVLFSWVMKLDASVDPALAAGALIERYGLNEPAPRSPEGRELIALLQETATQGLDSLRPRGTCGPRRRGRRSR
jgi:hypothetical protein